MAQQPPQQTDEQSDENFWLSCFFLRNLPANIPPQQLSSWVSETFQKQCTRIVYADEVTKDVCRSGSYLIELSSPTARSIFSRQGRGEHFFFNIRLHCEEVRSEQFAKKAFLADSSFNPLQSPGGTLVGNTMDNPLSPQPHLLPHIPQEESSLARRCLLLWQVEDHTFPVSVDTIMQLFQGCLGEAVKQTTILVPNSRNTRDKMMIEFSSEESVGRVLKAFDPKSRTLAVPVKLQAVKKRAGNFAKRCLSEAQRLATIDHNTAYNKKKDGRKKNPHNHYPTHILQSPVASIPQQHDFGFSRNSELQSPMPPPLFPEPVSKSQLGGMDPSPINLESLLPRDGEAPIGDAADPLGLSFMALGQNSSRNLRNESSFPSFNLPFVDDAERPSQEDPAGLLPLILDSNNGRDEPAPPWGGINSESLGLEQLWGGNKNSTPDSNTDDAPGRLFELEQKLYATERENAALIEQAIITEREMQTLREEMNDKDILIERLRKQLEEKDALLAEQSVNGKIL